MKDVVYTDTMAKEFWASAVEKKENSQELIDNLMDIINTNSNYPYTKYVNLEAEYIGDETGTWKVILKPVMVMDESFSRSEKEIHLNHIDVPFASYGYFFHSMLLEKGFEVGERVGTVTPYTLKLIVDA